MAYDESKSMINKALEEAVDKVREETSKVKPPSPHLRSIDAFTEFMSNLPPCVPPSEKEWNEGMKRAEEFHHALNGGERIMNVLHVIGGDS